MSWQCRPALSRQPGGVLPLRQVRGSREGFQGELAHGARWKPRGGGVDRFRPGDLVRPVGGPEVVRMDDLQLVIEIAALGLAADDAARAGGVLALQMRPMSAEEDQGEGARRVSGAYPPGLARSARLLVTLDGDDEGLMLAAERLGDARSAPLHDVLRRHEEEVAHSGSPRHALDEGGDAWADPLQAGDRREQGKENLRPHGVKIA